MKDRAYSERRFWDRFAGKYDAFIDRTLGKTYVRLLACLKEDLHPDDEVLEVATGTGLVARAICREVKSVHAVDISPEMIRVAKAQSMDSGCRNITFAVQDAYRLDFPDRTFDVVIASNVLHLLIDPVIPLMEMNRVLRPGGRLILPTFCHGENLRSRIVSFLMSLGGFQAQRRWSTAGFRTWLQEQGFIIRREMVIRDIIPLQYVVSDRDNDMWSAIRG